MSLRRIASVLAATGMLALPATAAHAVPSGQAISEDDIAFLRAAHQINLAEISGSRIAWQKTMDETVKNLAATFMRDHIRLDADLTRTARQFRVSLPSQPTEEQRAVAASYQAAEAQALDELFITTQLEAHRQAMRLTEQQAENGDDPQVSQLAEKAAPVIAAHHDLLVTAAADEGVPGYTKQGARP